MKNIFIATTIIFSLNATAQKSGVIIDTSKTKAEIFSKTLLWIAKNWGNSDKVIDTKDEAIGTILVKGGLKSVPKSEGFAVKGLTLTELTIIINDGKAKLDFGHTTFRWDAGTVWNFEDNNGGAQKQKWKADVLNEMDDLLASYKADFK